MITDGTSALKTPSVMNSWTDEQYSQIVKELVNNGCEYLKSRDEYTLLKEVLTLHNCTEVLNFCTNEDRQNPCNNRLCDTGVIYYHGDRDVLFCRSQCRLASGGRS